MSSFCRRHRVRSLIIGPTRLVLRGVLFRFIDILIYLVFSPELVAQFFTRLPNSNCETCIYHDPCQSTPRHCLLAGESEPLFCHCEQIESSGFTLSVSKSVGHLRVRNGIVQTLGSFRSASGGGGERHT